MSPQPSAMNADSSPPSEDDHSDQIENEFRNIKLKLKGPNRHSELQAVKALMAMSAQNYQCQATRLMARNDDQNHHHHHYVTSCSKQTAPTAPAGTTRIINRQQQQEQVSQQDNQQPSGMRCALRTSSISIHSPPATPTSSVSTEPPETPTLGLSMCCDELAMTPKLGGSIEGANNSQSGQYKMDNTSHYYVTQHASRSTDSNTNLQNKQPINSMSSPPSSTSTSSSSSCTSASLSTSTSKCARRKQEKQVKCLKATTSSNKTPTGRSTGSKKTPKGALSLKESKPIDLSSSRSSASPEPIYGLSISMTEDEFRLLAEREGIKDVIGEPICRLCNGLFSGPLGIALHMCPAMKRQTYRCDLCGEDKWKTKANLHSHIKWCKKRFPNQNGSQPPPAAAAAAIETCL